MPLQKNLEINISFIGHSQKYLIEEAIWIIKARHNNFLLLNCTQNRTVQVNIGFLIILGTHFGWALK